MRFLAFALTVTGCGASVPIDHDDSPTEWTIAAPDSAGTIVAAHRVSGGWSDQSTVLAITGGHIIASDADSSVIEELALSVGPIEVPPTVLGYPVQFTDIELTLEQPTTLSPRGEVQLALTWSLTNHGVTSPLGAPKLPPFPAEVIFDNNAARLTLALPGEVWQWADLVRLSDLELAIVARR